MPGKEIKGRSKRANYRHGGGPSEKALKKLGIPGALGRGKIPTKKDLQRMLARRSEKVHRRDIPTMAAKGGKVK